MFVVTFDLTDRQMLKFLHFKRLASHNFEPKRAKQNGHGFRIGKTETKTVIDRLGRLRTMGSTSSRLPGARNRGTTQVDVELPNGSFLKIPERTYTRLVADIEGLLVYLRRNESRGNDDGSVTGFSIYEADTILTIREIAVYMAYYDVVIDGPFWLNENGIINFTHNGCVFATRCIDEYRCEFHKTNACPARMALSFFLGQFRGHMMQVHNH